VDSEALSGNADGSIVNATEKYDGENSKYYLSTNVFVYDDETDGEVELIIVEVNNEWTF
jgi:hypothetical protein